MSRFCDRILTRKMLNVVVKLKIQLWKGRVKILELIIQRWKWLRLFVLEVSFLFLQTQKTHQPLITSDKATASNGTNIDLLPNIVRSCELYKYYVIIILYYLVSSFLAANLISSLEIVFLPFIRAENIAFSASFLACLSRYFVNSREAESETRSAPAAFKRLCAVALDIIDFAILHRIRLLLGLVQLKPLLSTILLFQSGKACIC